jgi:tRNA1Val (adenine37-N6)-methyltransferase
VFAPSDLSDDAFLCGRLQLWQPVNGYRAATDPVLLAAACPALSGDTVLDLGCGAGAASLCLGRRVPGLQITGLELQPDYAALARENAARNGIALEVVDGDLTQMPRGLRRSFDQVIANPPYYPRGGTPSPKPGRDTALRAQTPLSVWVEAAATRLRPGGWMTMICGADSLPDVLGAMSPRLGSTAILPLAPRQDRPALRILLRARKGGKGAFRLLSPFVIHKGDRHDGDRESYMPEANAVLREGADLLARFR